MPVCLYVTLSEGQHFRRRISTVFLFLLGTVRAENVLVRTMMGCVITQDGFPLSADERFVLNAKAQDYAMLENVVIPKPVCACKNCAIPF